MICSSSFWNLGSALRRSAERSFEQGDQIGGDAVIVVVRQAADLVELEGVVHLSFAEVSVIVHRRDVDMGRNAIDLGALAVGAVELLNRQLQGAAVGWRVWRSRRRTWSLIMTICWTVPLPNVLVSPMIRPRP